MTLEMESNTKIIVLAYVYPPDAGSGTFRTLYFMNALSNKGVNVTVVTAKTKDFHKDASVDEKLLDVIHKDITVIRCAVIRLFDVLLAVKGKLFKNKKSLRGFGLEGHPLSKRDKGSKSGFVASTINMISAVLTCPDQHVGWIPDVVLTGLRLHKQASIDCIYATGGPWSCSLAGAVLHKLSGLPLVVDFRDPWVSNPNFANKSPLVKWIEEKLEKFVVHNASYVIANTKELQQDFQKRYSCLNEKNISTITNGFEPRNARIVSQKSNCFTLVHAGELYLSRNPVKLLESLAQLIESGEIAKNCIHLKFVGGISINDQELETLLHSPHLAGVVEVMPRVPHQEALRLQMESDALLLIQPDFPLQIPRKLFEYISLRKPVLAISENGSATSNIINEKRLGVAVDNDTLAIKMALLEMYQRWADGTVRSLSLEKLNEFNNEVLAEKLRSIILSVNNSRKCDEI